MSRTRRTPPTWSLSCWCVLHSAKLLQFLFVQSSQVANDRKLNFVLLFALNCGCFCFACSKAQYHGDNDIKLNNGKLADLVPTMLELMGVEQPDVMDGKSLIARD